MIDTSTSYLSPYIFQYRGTLTKGQRKSHSRKIASFIPKYPFSAERGYTQALNDYMDLLYKATNDFLDKNYENWLSADRRDEEIQDLRTYIEEYLAVEYGVVDDYLVSFLLEKSTQIDAFNIDDWSRFVGTVIGTPTNIAKIIVPAVSVGTEKAIADWTALNKLQWTNVTNDFISKTTNIISSNVLSGVTLKQTREDLLKVLPKKDGEPDYNRAKLIARDQTANLNSQLNKNRMTDAGLDLYKWLTANDERVRGNPTGKYKKAIPSHYIMFGKYCKWGDASAISDDKGVTWRTKRGKEERKHAGMAINCRCSAVAILTEILNAIDESLDEVDY